VLPRATFEPVLRARYRPVELIEANHSARPAGYIAVLERRN